MEQRYLALDLGAESGRGVVGRFDGTRLTLDEIHRFPNVPVRLGETLHWNLPSLMSEVRTAIGKAATGWSAMSPTPTAAACSFA